MGSLDIIVLTLVGESCGNLSLLIWLWCWVDPLNALNMTNKNNGLVVALSGQQLEFETGIQS